MDDQDYMRHALSLGRRTLGATGKNPAVGCVLVNEGRVIGVGWTQPGGVPHAETEALAMAGPQAAGSTAYVSLEPCSHVGRTPPCAAALVAARVARVVTPFDDPDARVSGRGHAMLRQAGIEIETGVLVDEARRDLRGYLSRIVKGRPHVLLKLALSADGMIAAAPGVRTAITGEEANARTHLMRAQSDAIMVGAATVRIDNPSLTTRLPGLEHRIPIAVILDGSLGTPPTASLIANAHHRPVLILTTPEARNEALENSAAKLVRCRQTAPGRIDLADGLTQLGKLGINRLLVEGGARLSEALVRAELVDELILLRSPHKIGAQGVSASLDLDGFVETAAEPLGQDVMTRYENTACSPA